MTGMYAGSFDPITNGHVDLIERACALFDRVIVAIGVNDSKKAMFSIGDRMDMVEEIFDNSKTNVEVLAFDGLLIDFANRFEAVLIRGIRVYSDFEYEFQMLKMNRKISNSVETIFMAPSEEYEAVSSSAVKALYNAGSSIYSKFVPSPVYNKMREYYE